MPFADNRHKPWVLEQLRAQFDGDLSSIELVIDVGAGGGANLEFYGPWFEQAKWTAIEAWEPYVERFVLSRYALVVVGDAREVELPKCDVLFLGDVIEHMGKDEAIALYKNAVCAARVVVLSLPIVHYEQGAWGGNPYEEHRYHWSYDEVFRELPNIVNARYNNITGAFIAEGLP